MRDSFKISWLELLRMLKCLDDQQFHIRQDDQMSCTKQSKKLWEHLKRIKHNGTQPSTGNHGALIYQAFKYQNKDSENT